MCGVPELVAVLGWQEELSPPPVAKLSKAGFGPLYRGVLYQVYLPCYGCMIGGFDSPRATSWALESGRQKVPRPLDLGLRGGESSAADTQSGNLRNLDSQLSGGPAGCVRRSADSTGGREARFGIKTREIARKNSITYP